MTHTYQKREEKKKKGNWSFDFNRGEFIWKVRFLIINCTSFWRHLEFWKKQPWQECSTVLNLEGEKKRQAIEIQVRSKVTIRRKAGHGVAAKVRTQERLLAAWSWLSYLTSSSLTFLIAKQGNSSWGCCGNEVGLQIQCAFLHTTWHSKEGSVRGHCSCIVISNWFPTSWCQNLM